jgi:hypothetical protein
VQFQTKMGEPAASGMNMKTGHRLLLMIGLAILSACASQPSSASKLPSINDPSPAAVATTQAAGDARFIECAKAHGATVPSGFNPRHKPDLYQLSDAVNRACDQILQDSQPPMSAAQRQAWLNFVNCMRGHAISVSDPEFGKGEVTITFGQGVDEHSAAFQSAREACRQSSGVPAQGSA